jgi:hypothetical protein
MVTSNIEIYQMSYEESVSYFKRLKNMEKIRRTNGPGHASLPVDNKKDFSVTSSVGKSSKNSKTSNVWCHNCDKNNHNMADCRAISNFKQQKGLALKPMLDPERGIWLLFSFSKKYMHLKGS